MHQLFAGGQESLTQPCKNMWRSARVCVSHQATQKVLGVVSLALAFAMVDANRSITESSLKCEFY